MLSGYYAADRVIDCVPCDNLFKKVMEYHDTARPSKDTTCTAVKQEGDIQPEGIEGSADAAAEPMVDTTAQKRRGRPPKASAETVENAETADAPIVVLEWIQEERAGVYKKGEVLPNGSLRLRCKFCDYGFSTRFKGLAAILQHEGGPDSGHNKKVALATTSAGASRGVFCQGCTPSESFPSPSRYITPLAGLQSPWFDQWQRAAVCLP